MKYEVMIKILFLLLSRDKVTAKYIADRFDISVRTVMRYITAMSLAGVPIMSGVGRSGGFYISESFRLPASFLTENEFNRVIATLTSCNEQLCSEEINSAIEKLSATSKVGGKSVNLFCGNLIIDGSSWIGNDNVKNVLSVIETAIEKCLTVIIKYIDRQGAETEREIEPHVVILKQGAWYVYAYCRLRKGFRIFKISRVVCADATETTFIRRETDFSADKLADWFGELPTEYVDLEVDKSAKADVEEWLGVDAVYKTNGDKLYVSATLPYDGWLISRILGYGRKVRILSPDRLRQDVKTSATEVLNLYNE